MSDAAGSVSCPVCEGKGVLVDLRRAALGLQNGQLEGLADAARAGVLGRRLEVGRVAERYLDPKSVSLEAEHTRLSNELLVAAKALLKEREGDIRELTREEEERRTKQHVEVQRRLEELEKRRKELEEERLRETKDMRSSLDQIVRTILTPRGKGDVGEVVTIKDLKTACPQDDFTDFKSDRKGCDITATVMNGNSAAGKLIVSVKYDQKWESQFIAQARRNMEQEGAGWGILVSASFPHDALNEKVYLHRSGLLVAKPEYAPIAYLAMREAVLVSFAREGQLRSEMEKLGQKERVYSAVRDWITGESVTRLLGAVEEATRCSSETDGLIENLVNYVHGAGTKIKRLQQDLRERLIETGGALDDLRAKLRVAPKAQVQE